MTKAILTKRSSDRHVTIRHSLIGKVEPSACEGYATIFRKVDPYDNATMENLFKTVKYEEVYICEYKVLEDVTGRLPYFIENVHKYSVI